MNEFEELRKKIAEKKSGEGFLDLYHYLMSYYGWIPYEEFKKLPAEVGIELAKRIKADLKKYKDSIPKLKK